MSKINNLEILVLTMYLKISNWNIFILGLPTSGFNFERISPSLFNLASESNRISEINGTTRFEKQSELCIPKSGFIRQTYGSQVFLMQILGNFLMQICKFYSSFGSLRKKNFWFVTINSETLKRCKFVLHMISKTMDQTD